MKKSLIALAVLAASGAAMAQSSVTLFGIVDLGVRNVKQGGQSLWGMSKDGINSSRLGFRGVEDLGGGMRAGFWLEGALTSDTGDGRTTGAALDFQRRSTVSVMGGFGEIRLGRDYTPTFWNHTVFDPFGTNGVGSSVNTYGGAVTGATVVRSNNTIGYFLPGNLGGIYGQAMIGLKETKAANSASDYAGFRVGYQQGPLNVALAYGQEGTATATGSNPKRWNLGGSYNLGVANLIGQYTRATAPGSLKLNHWMLAATAPVGPGLLKASYTRSDYNGSNDANQIALGYEYNLSKRTALYTTYSRIANKGGAAFSVGAFAGQPATAPGGKSTGFEAGLRHSF